MQDKYFNKIASPVHAAIILINYKDYANRFLIECRDSLYRQTYPADFFKVYIVDNASDATSIKFLKQTYPEAIIVPRDDGNYAAANNTGINKAAKDGADFFIVANMDTMFAKNWLSELLKAVLVDKTVGMAQSKILLHTKKESYHINTLGNVMHFLGFGSTTEYGEPDRDIIGYPEITGYASGCSFIIRKDLFDEIGGYDEDYYMYHDDIEVGWKVKLAGYKIVLAPQSIVYHKYEYSRSMLMLYYLERNRYIAMFQFYSLATLLVLMPAIIAMDIGMLFFSMADGWFKIKLKTYLYFFRFDSWKKIAEKRKQIKKLSKIDNKKLLTHFKGKMVFAEISNPVLDHIANPVFNLYWSIYKKLFL